MSDDLISRKALLEEIRSFRCSITGLRAGKGVLASAGDEYRKSILQIIEDQPTAFDKEKVIEELRQEAMCELGIPEKMFNSDEGEYSSCCSISFSQAKRIVEKGGIERSDIQKISTAILKI